MKIVNFLLRALFGWKWPLKLGRTGKIIVAVLAALHIALFAVLLMPGQTQAHIATTQRSVQQSQVHMIQRSGQQSSVDPRNASCGTADPLYHCFTGSVPGSNATGSSSWQDGKQNGSQDPSISSPFGANQAFFFVTDVKTTVENSGVTTLWKGALWIVDSCMVVLLMLNGLRIILVGSIFRYADVVETLPKVFVALICAHISLFFAVSLIGLNNSLSYGIYQWSKQVDLGSATILVQGAVDDGSPQGEGDCVYDHYKDGGLFQPSYFYWKCTLSRKNDALSIVPPTINISNFWGNFTDLFNIGGLLLKLLGLMLLTQFIIRIFFINFYIILSPIGIAASALPGRAGQPLTRLWLSGFLSSIFVQFLQVIALIVIGILIYPMYQGLYNALVNVPNPIIQGSDLQLILKIAALWFIVRIPSLLGTAPMSTMVQTGQAMTQAATAIATTQIAEVQSGISMLSSAGGAALAFL